MYVLVNFISDSCMVERKKDSEPIDTSEGEAPFYLSLSENGLKTLTEEKILYTSKFHKIQWCCDPNYELPIKLSREQGPGAETPVTLSQAFLTTRARFKDQLCLQFIQDPEKSANPFEPEIEDRATASTAYRPIN